MSKLWILCLLLIVHNVSSACWPSCNSNSYCNGNTCACYTGYFTDSFDCDTRVDPLYKGVNDQGEVDSHDWTYYYIRLIGIDGSITMNIEPEDTTLMVYIVLQSTYDYDLPDQSATRRFTAWSDTTTSYTVSSSDIQNVKNGWMLIGIRNNSNDDVDFDILYTVNSDEDTSTTPTRSIIIGVAVAAGIIFLVGLCVWRRVKMRRMRFLANQRARHRGRRASRDVEAEPERVNQQDYHVDPNQNYAPVLSNVQILAQNPQNQNNLAPQPQVQPNHQRRPSAQAQAQNQNQNRNSQNHGRNQNHNHGNRPNQGQVQPQVQPQPQAQARRQGPQLDLLSKEEIDKYFPKQAFSKLSHPFPQTACSICLDEFRPETICHQLYCFHLFHEACIKSWLEKHDSCPDCRKPITKKAVKEWLKAEKKRREEEQKANKVKIMNSSVRASKAIHKAQAQQGQGQRVIQRQGSNHELHPQQ